MWYILELVLIKWVIDNLLEMPWLFWLALVVGTLAFVVKETIRGTSESKTRDDCRDT
jgi:uncharacterized membrane protein YbhN (UPF0104 family)